MKINKGSYSSVFRLGGASVRLRAYDPSTVVLVPGSGFDPTFGDSVTSVGSPGDAGYDAKAIARWDTVPFQTYDSGQINIGLMAFHINGIDRVEFYLDGGSAVSVSQILDNPDQGLPDYWATVDVASLDDGEHELRAIIYPSSAGAPRVMDGLIFTTNANGSLPASVVYVSPAGDDASGSGTEENPYRTFYGALSNVSTNDRNGLTIKAKAGEYVWTSGNGDRAVSSKRYVTIQPDDGLASSDVVITALDPVYTYTGLRTQRVCVKNLTFTDITPKNSGTIGGEGTVLWIDGCSLNGPGGNTEANANVQSWITLFSEVYATNSSITRWKDGFGYTASCNVVFAKDCSVTEIYSDAYSGCRFVANCTSSSLLYFAKLGYHPDIYQKLGATTEEESDFNTIVYNLKSTDATSAQGIFIANNSYAKNMAFVNVHITDCDIYSQFSVPNMSHILLRGCTLPEMEFRNTVSSAADFQFYGNVHELMQAESPFAIDAGWFDQNHFRSGSTFGTNATSGDPANLFADPAAGDFSPGEGSPILERLSSVIYVEDVNGQQRQIPDTIGAYYS